jgi:hypothetical protein
VDCTSAYNSDVSPLNTIVGHSGLMRPIVGRTSRFLPFLLRSSQYHSQPSCLNSPSNIWHIHTCTTWPAYLGLHGNSAGKERERISTKVIKLRLPMCLAQSLPVDCRCNFRKKPHHAGDNVFMPESFPVQDLTDAEPEGSVLDLPREDLDEASNGYFFRDFAVSHACIS